MSRLRRRVVEPVKRFLEIEAATGIVLATATVVALVWANSPVHHSYDGFWDTGLGSAWPARLGELDLRHVVDDGLMAVFFFVVGLEIKREWLEGSLSDRRFARLPIAAALGGMIVPAVLYLAIAGGTPAGHGWGIPMATDIAFVVGVMAVLGDRVSDKIRVFLLTLAIVDDLGAIVVIAAFYARGVHWWWLLAAGSGVVAMLLLRKLGVERLSIDVVIAVLVWYATWRSGVHATIAGVALAFITPMRRERGGESFSPLAELEERLHPVSGFVIVPLFALANAGVSLSSGFGDDGTRVALGVAVGLVIGKPAGVVGASWIAERVGFASRGEGLGWAQLLAAGVLAGIGFTMSLFITSLAFDGPESLAFVADAKKAILAGSVVAAIVGSVAFAVVHRRVRQR